MLNCTLLSITCCYFQGLDTLIKTSAMVFCVSGHFHQYSITYMSYSSACCAFILYTNVLSLCYLNVHVYFNNVLLCFRCLKMPSYPEPWMKW